MATNRLFEAVGGAGHEAFAHSYNYDAPLQPGGKTEIEYLEICCGALYRGNYNPVRRLLVTVWHNHRFRARPTGRTKHNGRGHPFR